MSIKKLPALFLLFSQLTLTYLPKYTFTLMLDPAGDAKHTGRKISHSLERGITLQFCEKIKKDLESTHPQLRVVLTRFPGETVQPLQNANFANRLNVDCYVSIHFFQEKETKPQVYLYTFSYGHAFANKTTSLAFYPYDQAHLINFATTKIWADHIQLVLNTKTYKKLFQYKGMFNLPFRPIIGVKAPAMAFEMSLKHKDDWQLYIEPIVASLTSILEQTV